MKRANGEGTLRQRANGLWEARYIAADGRQRSLYGKVQQDVLKRLRDAQGEAQAGLRPTPMRLTTGDWLDEWLMTSVRPRLRPTTIASYEDIVSRYLRPRLGRIALARLTPDHVAEMVAELLDEGRLSPTSVRYVYAVLRISLGRAVKLGRVTRNVATMIDPPTKAPREIQPLSRDELGVLLGTVAGDRLEGLWITAVATGMRQGELLALRWSDIDLDRGAITVHHTLRRGARTLAVPKTDRARRTLLVGPQLVAVLREHRRRQVEERLAAGFDWQNGDFVFSTPKGRPLDGVNVTHAFQAQLRRAGLRPQRFHDLRHAYTTTLLEAGEELAVVSRLLGHADLSTTADVYGHLTRSMAGRAAGRIDEMLATSRNAAG